jgi:RNA polymerase sigma-70 factor, ECF subfamily
MPPTSKPLISQTPAANGAAQDATRNRLVTLLYPELRKLAWRHLNAERADHTLQTTALVNEVFLEIARDETNRWADRAHFLAAASQIMRRVLIDYARRRCASKRGGGAVRIELEADDLPDTFEYSRLIELNQLLDQLAAEQPRMAQVVEMRCFGGLDCKEIGSALGIDERTVKRDWQFAKAWLAGQLRRG